MTAGRYPHPGCFDSKLGTRRKWGSYPVSQGLGCQPYVGTAAEIEPTTRASGISWSAGRN